MNFPKISEKLSYLRANIKDPNDLKLVDQTEAAANGYSAAISQAQNAWLKLNELAVKREDAGRALIDACIVTAKAGMEGTQSRANQARDSLSFASSTMLVGLAIVAALGITLAIFITKGAGPLGRVVAALRGGSEQVSDASSQVSSSSQQMASGASQQAASLESQCLLRTDGRQY